MAVNKDELTAQIAALQKQLDSGGDDDGTELWVKDENGRETRLTGAYAKKWLKNLGLEDEPDPAGGDPAGGGAPDPPPAGGDSIWGRKGGGK